MTKNAATDKPGFVLYKDLQPILDKLTVPQCGHLMKAIFHYQNTGELSELDPVTEIAMISVVSHFKRDALKYENTCVKRREAGSKGGKQKVANASKPLQDVANVADIDIDIDIDREIETDIDLKNNVAIAPAVSEPEIKAKSPTPKRVGPPPVEEVIAYAIQVAGDKNPCEYIAAAKKAHAFYERNMRELNATTWKDGNGNPVKNWKLKINNNWFSKVVEAKEAKKVTYI